MSEIDLDSASEILKALQDPALADRERQIAAREPQRPTNEVLDLALESAVLALRYSLNRQTFEYLRWKVVAARETARAVLAASDASRAERIAAQDALSRSYYDHRARRWTVTETEGNSASHAGRRCLIFASGDALRRVWEYPENWHELDSMGLERLSWNR